jgi:hypothetical protein
MTTDERQNWLEELLAASDAVSSGQTTPALTETSGEMENVEETPEEDFATSSG